MKPDLGCTLRDRRTRCSVFAVLPLSARLCGVCHCSHNFSVPEIADYQLSTFNSVASDSLEMLRSSLIS